MSFEAITLQYLEDALSECFNYHDALDNFLIRAGVSKGDLAAARADADRKAKGSPRDYSRAPKRFVVQSLITNLTSKGSDGDYILSNLITNVLNGKFPAATKAANDAINNLSTQLQNDRVRKEARQKRKETNQREMARKAERSKEKAVAKTHFAKDALRKRFLELIGIEDAQKRGYLFEAFLTDTFTAEHLKPRSPFRNVGEQIDRSFVWGNQTHLVEAKWAKEPVAGAAFSSLLYKVEGKTLDTRGLFISVNGYSTEAITGLNSKGSLRFVCIDGAHIMRCLEVGQSLVGLLETVWRHANETGEAYLNVGRFPKR